MQKKKKLRAVLCTILTFFLAVGIFLLFFCAVMSLGFVSEGGIKSAIKDSCYVSQSVQGMKEELSLLYQRAKLPKEMAEQVVDSETCYLALNQYLEETIEGKECTVSVAEFQDTVTSYLETYLEENEILITPEVERTTQGLVKKSVAIYQKHMQPEFGTLYHKWEGSIPGTLTIGMILSLLAVALISLVLCLQFHYKHRAIRYLCQGWMTALIWHGICLAVFYVKQDPVQWGIGPDYYVEFLDTYLRRGCGVWLLVLVAGILGILGLQTLGNYLKHHTD